MYSVFLTLISSALLCKASKKCLYVPAGSVVALLEEIKDLVNEHGQMVQQVKAGFIDPQDVVSVEATFILPTKLPQDHRAGRYQVDFDPQNLVYRVTTRVQSNPVYPQADFGHQITTFQPQTPEESDEDGCSLAKESIILKDENTSSTTESTIAAEVSILDSYVRAICSARSLVHSFPLAIRQESVWLNALDIDEPMGTSRHRSSLEWLDLASTDDIISTTRILLDVAESFIAEPKDTMVLEPSSTDHEHVAEKHPDVQEQTVSQNQGSSWGDSIDLDAAFGGSATDLAEDFPDPNATQNQDSRLNKSQWKDVIDLDVAFGGSGTDLEEEEEYQANKSQQDDSEKWEDVIDLDAAFGGSATDLEEEEEENQANKSQQESQQDDDSQKKWEDVIDLDAAFGGSATDLEEEGEEEEEEFEEDVNNNSPQATAAVYVAATASLLIREEEEEKDTVFFFKSPNLRQHIPDDIEERVKHICQTRFTDDEDGQVVAGGKALAKACAEWEYMSEAARENKRLGLFKRQGKIPEEAKTSCGATSWDKEEWLPTATGNKPSSVRLRPLAAAATVDDERAPGPGPGPGPGPCHHINFLGDPCDTRSNTSPEDSFWAVITSKYKRFHHETFSRQGVIIAQANKLLDPFEYDPTGCDLSQLTGSKLRDAVVGKVRKVYLDCGRWVDDVDYCTTNDQHVPVPLSYESMMSRNIYWKGTYLQYSLRQPHRINNLHDLDDLVVFKGEIIPPKRHYREPTDLFLPTPSKLCNMELVEEDGEQPEARPESNGKLQKVRLAAPADRALDRAPESQGHKVRDGQMETTRLGIDLDEEGESFTSSQRDKKQTSNSEVEKANEDLLQILESVAARPSASPSSSELEEEEEEDSSSLLCDSRGKFSSVFSTSSSELELTALEEVKKLDGEINFVLLGQLSQLQVDHKEKEEDVRDFVNGLPSPIRFDDDDVVLGDGDQHTNEEERLVGVEEIVCNNPPDEKAASYHNLPQQDRIDKEEGEGLFLLVNENIPLPAENGYRDLTTTTTPQESPQSKEEQLAVVEKIASQPAEDEDVSLARIRALEAVLMREFDFSKKIEIPYSDVSEIPLKQGDNNEKLYGPISIAIGRKALELTDWFRSWMLWCE